MAEEGKPLHTTCIERGPDIGAAVRILDDQTASFDAKVDAAGDLQLSGYPVVGPYLRILLEEVAALRGRVAKLEAGNG